MEQLLYKDITYDIRGACFWVWKEFGGAFKEKVIDRALTVELKRRGRRVEDQKRLDIEYQGVKVGTYVPDKIVDYAVLVELKSKEFLTSGDIDQFWKYLKGSKYKVGMLINFGPTGLEIKRVVYDTARSVCDPRPDLRNRSALRSAAKGFTLMEIVVATTIFAIVFSSLLAMFNYVLKINRRSEALRQASQGARDFVEFLVKEIRNGKVDYYISNGSVYTSGVGTSPCQPVGGSAGSNIANPTTPSTYSLQDNKLGIINTDSVQECFYYGNDSSPTPGYVGTNTFSAPSGHKYNLLMQKAGIAGVQVLNPPNMRIDNLMFVIRPICDPYTASCRDYVPGLPKIQPTITILIKFVAQLPTGEQFPIYYQTSVSSDKYDIPQS
jgi:GxxExxY protein